MLSIPNKVGIKYFLNNVHTSSVPKSIAFLFICVCYSYGYFYLPSDEDYKTLLFVVWP